MEGDLEKKLTSWGATRPRGVTQTVKIRKGRARVVKRAAHFMEEGLNNLDTWSKCIHIELFGNGANMLLHLCDEDIGGSEETLFQLRLKRLY